MSSYPSSGTSGSLSCYKVLNSGPKLWEEAFPCGNVNTTSPDVMCCHKGDQCLSDGLCKFTHSQELTSGFYVAPCTSKTGDGEGCKHGICADHDWPDVVFADGRWACCGDSTKGGPNCTQVTNEFFNAPSPSSLATLFSVPPSGYFAISTAIQSASPSAPAAISSIDTPATSRTVPGGRSSSLSILSSSTSPATSSQPPKSSTEPINGGGGRLSKGAIAGIGVGVGLAVIVCLVGSLILFRRRKQRQKIPHPGNNEPPTYPEYKAELSAEPPAPMLAELPSTPKQ
ncbi:unnamed protein product [Periconia digitata]|uniref:Uncharacterized protein n=1 Tax=Periconia digitata TaxID=1303443 RepID=A0A9W4UWL1_9PLEO|nr:unnamed protein product [Periconia digitata]